MNYILNTRPVNNRPGAVVSYYHIRPGVVYYVPVLNDELRPIKTLVLFNESHNIEKIHSKHIYRVYWYHAQGEDNILFRGSFDSCIEYIYRAFLE